nr:MAG TPA: hypothetical protein [Caudoviricetes sp.]
MRLGYNTANDITTPVFLGMSIIVLLLYIERPIKSRLLEV